jgi:hypothetical protein
VRRHLADGTACGLAEILIKGNDIILGVTALDYVLICGGEKGALNDSWFSVSLVSVLYYVARSSVFDPTRIRGL